MNKLVMITQNKCDFCLFAEQLLEEHDIEYAKISLSEESGTEWLRTFLGRSGINTVPAIFEEGVYIGGYKQLKERLESERYKVLTNWHY